MQMIGINKDQSSPDLQRRRLLSLMIKNLRRKRRKKRLIVRFSSRDIQLRLGSMSFFVIHGFECEMFSLRTLFY